MIGVLYYFFYCDIMTIRQWLHGGSQSWGTSPSDFSQAKVYWMSNLLINPATSNLIELL